MPNSFCHVGHRPSWPIPETTGQLKRCRGRGGLVQQMGRGCTSQKHDSRGHRGISLEEHHYPVWGSQDFGLSQWTTVRLNGETPFSLVYGTEVVLPIEVCLTSITQIGYHEKKNEERLRENLDFIDEASQLKNRNILNPKYEGPYRVRRVVGRGTYELEEHSRNPIDHTWHGIYLKKYYV
ncbi:hypothetical protein LIER_24027 [Lithospermum erythrorhizon]|uniref:Reverse transcriptase domain-containing protein n=1 Tax=Lithospermum erythrorhizon TaxID=34254 RepID=A0AAV3R2P1_LITER